MHDKLFTSEFVSGILALLRSVSIEVLKIYEDENLWSVDKKSDESPLTMADKIANNLICKYLNIVTPEIKIISEENAQIPFPERIIEEYLWCIDPLDGTKEFIKKNGEFAINIALLRRNKAVAGFVSVPCSSTLYWAVKEQGAYRVNKDGSQDRLHASEFNIEDSKLIVLASRSHLNEKTDEFINSLNNPIIKSAGSSLKFILIAEGKAHLYPRLAPTMEWDTAAPQLILEEAGGMVLESINETPLAYNKANLLNPNFIAYGNLNNERV
jgi:3'(2'), 5'-bisphosphate nucleotidase